MKLSIQAIGNDIINIADTAITDVTEMETFAETATAEEIAALFPGGTAIDQSCIALCNEFLGAVKAVKAAVPGASASITGLFSALKVNLAQAIHNSSNPKHNLGYYLTVVGSVLQTLAAKL